MRTTISATCSRLTTSPGGFHPPSIKDLLVDRPPDLYQPIGHRAGGISARRSMRGYCPEVKGKVCVLTPHPQGPVFCQFPCTKNNFDNKTRDRKIWRGLRKAYFSCFLFFFPSQAAGNLNYIKQARATPPTSCTDENIPHHPTLVAHRCFLLAPLALGQQKCGLLMEQRTFHILFKGTNTQAAHLQECCKGQRPISCYHGLSDPR